MSNSIESCDITVIIKPYAVSFLKRTLYLSYTGINEAGDKLEGKVLTQAQAKQEQQIKFTAACGTIFQAEGITKPKNIIKVGGFDLHAYQVPLTPVEGATVTFG